MSRLLNLFLYTLIEICIYLSANPEVREVRIFGGWRFFTRIPATLGIAQTSLALQSLARYLPCGAARNKLSGETWPISNRPSLSDDLLLKFRQSLSADFGSYGFY